MSSFDARTSTDSDGIIASHTWGFGDGTTGTGATTTHSYTAEGSYNVTLTVTDNKGATGTTTHPVTATITPPPTGVLANDTFTRTTTAGLGTADTGGAWTPAGTAANFATNGKTATLTTPARTSNFAYLNTVSSNDTDLQATLSFTRPTASSLYTGLIARKVGTATYGARTIISPNGAVTLNLQRNTDTILARATIPGLSYTTGDELNLRVQATGTSPTTIQAKAWKAGTTEPATWQLTTTDNTTGLQTAGSIGIYSYLSTTGTPTPITVAIDNFHAKGAAK